MLAKLLMLLDEPKIKNGWGRGCLSFRHQAFYTRRCTLQTSYCEFKAIVGHHCSHSM